VIDLKRYRALGKKVAAVGGGVVFCAGFAGSGSGQGLPAVPGLTVLQQPVASTVQDVCIALNGLGGKPPIANPNPNGTPSQRLSNSCTLMVSSSLFNQGITPPFDPNGQFNLKISNAQIATGVQAIAPVQMNAQKQIGVEAAKVNGIGARLLDLRGGARGLVVGLNGESGQTAASAAQTGGAAAADDAGGGPWGGFLNVAYSWGNVDQTTLQDAYKYGSFSLLAGADYRVNDKFVIGGAISYSDTHSDYDQSLGKVKAQTVGVLGYGTYYVDDWYVDGLLAYGAVNYDSTRNINIPSNNPAAPAIITAATASPKGDQWSAAIGVGKNFVYDTTNITPFLRLGYIWVKNKAFSEDEPVDGLGLAVNERTIRSLQSALGAKVSKSFSTSSGVFTPYFSAQWMHEFENDNPSIISKYVADPTNQFFAIPTANPTRDYAVLILGSSAQFANNLSGFLQFSAAAGLQNETNYGVVLGVRKQF
jgi:outer membrane lipase/esterase